MAVNDQEDIERLLEPVAGAKPSTELRARVLTAAESAWRPAPSVLPWFVAAAAAILLGLGLLQIEEQAMTNALHGPDRASDTCIACRYDVSPERWRARDSWWQTRRRELESTRSTDG